MPTVNVGVRQKGRLAAKSVIHCTTTVESIKNAIEDAVAKRYKPKEWPVSNPYGVGNASSEIIKMIKEMRFLPMKSFHDLKV